MFHEVGNDTSTKLCDILLVLGDLAQPDNTASELFDHLILIDKRAGNGGVLNSLGRDLLVILGYYDLLAMQHFTGVGNTFGSFFYLLVPDLFEMKRGDRFSHRRRRKQEFSSCICRINLDNDWEERFFHCDFFVILEFISLNGLSIFNFLRSGVNRWSCLP